MSITRETHEQPMVCVACGLRGKVPNHSRFPLPVGPWDQRCPACDEWAVVILPVREADGDRPDE